MAEQTTTAHEVPSKADIAAYIREAYHEAQLRAHESAVRWAKKHGVQPQEKPRTLSQWAMGLLRDCPHKYFLAQIVGIRTILKGAGLAFGSAIDEAVEARLSVNGNLQKAQEAFRVKWAEEEPGVEYPEDWTAADFQAAGQNLVNLMEPHLDKMQPLHVQRWLQWTPILDPITGLDLVGYVFSGKIDVVDLVQLDGMEEPAACITDAKALVQVTKPADHYLNTRLSLQLALYAYCAKRDEMLMDLPGIGRLVGYFEGQRKKVPKPPKVLKSGALSKAKPAEPPIVQRTFADVGQAEFDEVLLIAGNYVRQIAEYKRREAAELPLEIAWPRNMVACGRDSYGRPCEYRPLCRGHLYGEHPGLEALYKHGPRKEVDRGEILPGG